LYSQKFVTVYKHNPAYHNTREGGEGSHQNVRTSNYEFKQRNVLETK